MKLAGWSSCSENFEGDKYITSVNSAGGEQIYIENENCAYLGVF